MHCRGFIVREGGLEPPRPFGHQHLKLARLPFRHSRKWSTNVSAPYDAWHARHQQLEVMSGPTRDRLLAHRSVGSGTTVGRLVGEVA